jgi:hypothetical protein
MFQALYGFLASDDPVYGPGCVIDSYAGQGSENQEWETQKQNAPLDGRHRYEGCKNVPEEASFDGG